MALGAPGNTFRKPLELIPFPQRNGTVTIGRQQAVWVNAFELVAQPDASIYHYDVVISTSRMAEMRSKDPAGGARDLKPELARLVIGQLSESGALGGLVGYDGRKNIYAPREIPGVGQQPKTFEIEFKEEGRRPVMFNVTIAQTNSGGGQNHHINLAVINDFITGRARNPDHLNEALMALNTIINTEMWLKHANKKSSFFEADAQRGMAQQGGGGGGGGGVSFQQSFSNFTDLAENLKRGGYGGDRGGGRGGGRGGRGGGRGGFGGGGGMAIPSQVGAEVLGRGIEMWRGFYSSLRLSPRGIICNVDLTHQPFIVSGDLGAVAAAIGGMDSVRDLVGACLNRDSRTMSTIERILKKATIDIPKANEPGKTVKRTIFAIGRLPASQEMFDCDGKTISVADYWRQAHNIQLQYPDLPCVLVSKTAKIPMEVCTMRIGNKYNRTLSPEQTAAAIKFTTLLPQPRTQFIRNVGFLKQSANPILRDVGLEFKPELMRINARMLNYPTLQFADRQKQAKTQPIDNGTWRTGNVCFRSAATLDHWAILILGSERDRNCDRNAVEGYVRGLVQAMTQNGMNITKSNPPITYSEGDRNMSGLFKRLGGDYHSKTGAVPQLVVVFISGSGTMGPEYCAVKRVADLELGVATQCLSTQKVTTKANNTYWANVGLKINVKLRGVNQIVDKSSFAGWDSVPSMIFGADATHPAPDSRDPSIAGVVGSLDRFAASYAAVRRIQPSRQEYIGEIGPMVESLLDSFKKRNGVYPKRILFYRDGVSEGQYQVVMNEEIPKIREALRAKCGDGVQLTYLVAAKRHHYRFSPVDQRDGDRNGNCLPGVVVDTDITSPLYWDWYLQSHAGLLGTSRNTHYIVLVDDYKFKADDLIQLTYSLCYLYARATRSVSIVTPAYYAHHVCTRATVHAKENNDDASSISGVSDASEERRLKFDDFTRRLDRDIHANLADTLYYM